MRVVSLASGSKGNAYLVGANGDWLLIDDGLPYKALSKRMGAYCQSPLGVLVTHAHNDHISGLGTLYNYQRVPIYANALTIDAIQQDSGIPDEAFACFENTQHFAVGKFDVVAFQVPHDDSDPVGYLIRADEETYFHGTDLGTPLPSIGTYFAQAEVATIESNHDVVLLRTSGRPQALISRILGPRGHLSNEQAAGFVARYASPRLRRIGLAHLSGSCNNAALALATIRRALDAVGRTDLRVVAYEQDAVVAI